MATAISQVTQTPAPAAKWLITAVMLALMPVVGRIYNSVNVRFLVFVGLSALAFSQWSLAHRVQPFQCGSSRRGNGQRRPQSTATMMAYNDANWICLVLVVAVMPLVMLLPRRAPLGGPSETPHSRASNEDSNSGFEERKTSESFSQAPPSIGGGAHCIGIGPASEL